MSRREKICADILNSYIRCKYEAGGGDIRISQIAEKSGISTRTLHRYYPNKDDLMYDAAVEFLNTRYSQFVALYEHSDHNGDTGLERLLDFLRIQREHYMKSMIDAVMMVSAGVRYASVSLDKKKISVPQIGSDVRKVVVSAIERGITDRSIRGDIDPLQTCIMISANYTGIMQRIAEIYNTGNTVGEKDNIFFIFDQYLEMLENYLHV